MSRTQRIAITALLLTAGASRAQAQGLPIDVRSIKPVMMLLVDTSGSMERMTNDTRLPVCQNNTVTDANEKNRWTVTLEALTGTYQSGSFSCQQIDRGTLDPDEMDYGYYLPHFAVTTPPALQASDGILDAFMYRLKFGLMTFDGVGTTLTGDSLVPFDDFANEPMATLNRGAQGMYSYGNNKKLVFPGCEDTYGFNAGARRYVEGAEAAFPGALIRPGLDDDGEAVAAVNASIQSGLAQVRPFGSTPLAAMFDDLKYYIENEDDIKQGSDPFYACRDRYALLLTDSAGDANELFRDERFRCDTEPRSSCAFPPSQPDLECECPYNTDLEIVDDLTAGSTPMLDKLFVLAFNVTDPDALAELDEIADHGKSDEAMRATTPNDLRDRLNDLMSSVQQDATTRSVPVHVDTGASVQLGGRQFEITSGFQLGETDDDAWSGVLYRRRIGCDNALPTEFTLDDSQGDFLHERLNAMDDADRRLYTLAPVDSGGGTLAQAARGTVLVDGNVIDDDDGPNNSQTNDNEPVSGTFSGSLLTGGLDSAQGLSNTVSGVITFTDTGALDANYFGDADGGGAGQPGDRTKIVEFVRGLSRSSKMADIYHSQPAVLPPLDINASTTRQAVESSDERLTAFRRGLLALSKYQTHGRPGVVFVGTNDGILHAISLEDVTIDGRDWQAGEEFWGFVPPALFDKMHTAAIPTHQTMFDGSPVISDITMPRVDEAPEYRTVLVSAVRGAPAFVALDITQPDELKVLWQFSDVYMGETVGNPAITHLRVEWDGEVQTRAVAVLPGGAGTSAGGPCAMSATESVALFGPSPRNDGRCWELPGRSLYVVDIMTGKLIQRFDPRHFNAPLTGTVTVENPGLGLSTAAYLADQDGILWRLSMMNPDADDWRVQPVWDLFEGEAWNGGRPASFEPLVTKDASGNNVILVGTGDLDNLVDTVQHRVLSLTEVRDFLGDGEILGNMTKNWEIRLATSESVTGPLVVFDETVYFGAFAAMTDEDDACQLGQSRLFGAHVTQIDPDNPTLPRPMLAADADNDGAIDSPLNLVLSDNTQSQALVLGVAITRQPVCAVGSVDNDPLNAFNSNVLTGGANRFAVSGPVSGGTFKLKALAGGTGISGTGGSALGQVSQTLNIQQSTSFSAWASSVE